MLIAPSLGASLQLPRRVVEVPVSHPDPETLDRLLHQEWLVTNGLGGYAAGTVAGVSTRRYHGLLVAALPVPWGRTMMLNHVSERWVPAVGEALEIGGWHRSDRAPEAAGLEWLESFELDGGLPVWRYRIGGLVLERRLVLLHRQNTLHLTYTLVGADGPLTLEIAPALHLRGHDEPVDAPLFEQGYRLRSAGGRHEIEDGSGRPPLRLAVLGPDAELVPGPHRHQELLFRLEESRGYASRGSLWSPGRLRCRLAPGESATLLASTEPWEVAEALSPAVATQAEAERRSALVEAFEVRNPALRGDAVAAELVLAADQFLVEPRSRGEEAVLSRAQGEEPRTVIAGYHWFTDWGRDTMISLEGLTLVTGRLAEARHILLTFAKHVRDGLVPNFFSEREGEGLYHTADASLWFFHAVDRYLAATEDVAVLHQLLPKLEEIVAAHLAGTRFGIGVDPRDRLLRQGAEGYQLTWMDAKVDDWVVTPRRGKAVEINALWHDALCLLATFRERVGGDGSALRAEAARHAASFNRRFWYAAGGHLFDVVDGEEGDDPALRPNQLLAISLRFPVLAAERWAPVLETVQRHLLTPLGLRTLDPRHPSYQTAYFGDLRSRDAAYHQGTVWAWLIGPFVDAWSRVHPGEVAEARKFLDGLVAHLGDAGLGSVSEIFDAEGAHVPRGCVAQAWSVAELLRCWALTAPPPESDGSGGPVARS